MSMIHLEIVLDPGAATPRKSRHTDAGIDIANHQEVALEPHVDLRIPTGVHVSIPQHYWGLIHPRSSTRSRWGLKVRTSVIDHGFYGELQIGVRTTRAVIIPAGTRLAQLVLLPVPPVTLHLVDEFTDREPARGDNGFGSSGW